jgi:hypothetical protein
VKYLKIIAETTEMVVLPIEHIDISEFRRNE